MWRAPRQYRIVGKRLAIDLNQILGGGGPGDTGKAKRTGNA
jgi:hypothetical protein